MKVVIIGQKYFAGAVLEALAGDGHEIIGAIAPSNCDQLAFAAKRRDIPLAVYDNKPSADDLPLGADVIVAAHCHHFIDGKMRAKTRLGALGYHPSLLPRHRGRDAIKWALRMREAITGGTIYWMDDGADTGDIAAQEAVFIRLDDTPRSLWERELAPLGVRLFRDVLGDLDKGVITRKPQDTLVATFEPSLAAKELRCL
jgi:methionyl-tRNA formyltransferase